MPSTPAPDVGGARLAASSAIDQNRDPLLRVAGIVGLIGALVIIPIEKVL